MLKESIDLLEIKENGIYIDGTLGRGGHSSEILKRIPDGHLYAFDKDEQAIESSRKRLSAIGSNFTLIHQGFEKLDTALDEQGVDKIDGLMLDLGVSSPQFDDPERGFSYRYDARLDMRMDQSQQLSAHEVVNNYPYGELCRIFTEYGEEKFARQIARKIEQQRSLKPIDTTLELVEVIKSALPAKVVNSKGHPAKKTFQAIRIEVNDELGALRTVLDLAAQRLNVDGRICVITFQSLEDRIVKRKFNELAKPDKVDKRLPQIEKEKDYQLVTRKPIIAGDEELSENNRSHSAKLRVLRKVR